MRSFANAILLGGLAGCSICVQAQAGSQPGARPSAAASAVVPRLPMPTGPYGIGRIGYDWTDGTRRDRYSQDSQAHRELMVYVWYPSATKRADIQGVYMPGAKQMDAVPEIQHAMREDYQSNWPLIVSNAIFSHAAEDAPVAKNPRQFPVVILSHGLGGSGFGYTALIEELVSHGYVIAAIDHTETATAVYFPDGRLIPFHRDPPAPGLSPEESWKRMVESVSVGIEEGAADVRFVLDRLVELNAGKPTSSFAGRLDLSRVAAMGHSAGAEFAARACELDARFRACVDLDGGMVPVAALPEYPDKATMKQPLLFLEGNHDEAHMGGTHAQHLDYFKKREEQLEKCPPGTYAVVLRSPGITHGSFSDDPFLEAGGDPDKLRVAQHNFELIYTYIQGFLATILDHEKGTLFDTHRTANPEVEVTAYGH